MKLECGDCFDLFPMIKSGSVDLILTDPPYGITACEWDIKPDIPRFFCEAWRVLKPNGSCIIFGTVKSGIDWIINSRKEFRYDLVWEKSFPSRFLQARKMPMRKHESIFVFYRKLPVYHPQKTTGKPYKKTPANRTATVYKYKNSIGGESTDGSRYPVSIIKFNNADHKNANHNTLKPITLLSWIIKTYTNEGETVLDPFMGSGSTGVACMQTGRNFIGFEKEQEFFNKSMERIAQTQETQL